MDNLPPGVLDPGGDYRCVRCGRWVFSSPARCECEDGPLSATRKIVETAYRDVLDEVQAAMDERVQEAGCPGIVSALDRLVDAILKARRLTGSLDGPDTVEHFREANSYRGY